MTDDELYKPVLKVIDGAFDSLYQKVDAPECVLKGVGHDYRFKAQSIKQAIIQKLARLVTNLRAMSLLHKAGLIQEQAALQRTHLEFFEDIMFLCFGIINHDITDLHKKYLTAFYQEAINDSESEMKCKNQVPIPRNKIRAFNSRNLKDVEVSGSISAMQESMKMVNKTFSGFVHGASPYLMELYFGNPPRFQLSGGIDSPFYENYKDHLIILHYMSILAFRNSARAFNDESLCNTLQDFSRDFAFASG